MMFQSFIDNESTENLLKLLKQQKHDARYARSWVTRAYAKDAEAQIERALRQRTKDTISTENTK